MIRDDLKGKLLKMVAAFEVGGNLGAVAGNFDGQIISWGPLQWNLGRGTLQPILRQIAKNDPDLFINIMGKEFYDAVLSGKEVDFAKANILDKSGNVLPRWRERFYQLANTDAAQRAFALGADPYFRRAENDAIRLAVRTERGLAFCFDVAVQNGGIRKDHLACMKDRPDEEWEFLKMMAMCVANAANPQWRNDVLQRKLTIALGRGKVHGREYDLERDFGISYNRNWS